MDQVERLLELRHHLLLQVPADAAQELLGGGDHAAELAGLGGGGLHAEHHADDRDLAARHRPERGEGQAPARLRARTGLDAHDPVMAQGGIDVVRHAGDRQRDLRHGHDPAEGRDLQRGHGEPALATMSPARASPAPSIPRTRAVAILPDPMNPHLFPPAPARGSLGGVSALLWMPMERLASGTRDT